MADRWLLVAVLCLLWVGACEAGWLSHLWCPKEYHCGGSALDGLIVEHCHPIWFTCEDAPCISTDDDTTTPRDTDRRKRDLDAALGYDEKAAKSMLVTRHSRARRSLKEECCGEACCLEEIREKC